MSRSLLFHVFIYTCICVCTKLRVLICQGVYYFTCLYICVYYVKSVNMSRSLLFHVFIFFSWSLSTSSYPTPSIYLMFILIPPSLLLLLLPSIPGLYQPLPTYPLYLFDVHSNSTMSPPTSPAFYPWSLLTSSYITICLNIKGIAIYFFNIYYNNINMTCYIRCVI